MNQSFKRMKLKVSSLNIMILILENREDSQNQKEAEDSALGALFHSNNYNKYSQIKNSNIKPFCMVW